MGMAMTRERPFWLDLRERGLGLTAAAEILRLMGISEPPIDVAAITRALGVGLYANTDRAWRWSGQVKSSQDRADIWINAFEHPVRQRFTLAHELGHLMLHPLGEEFRDDQTLAGGGKETQANEFAASLLMPFSMLHPIARAVGTDSRWLAGHFQVSEAAMDIRLQRMLGVRR
jgi:predicted transcriptional regulator